MFEGLGNTISNLTINLPSASYVGLFGYAGTSAAVANVKLANGNVTGLNYIGELIGFSSGTIENAWCCRHRGGLNHRIRRIYQLRIQEASSATMTGRSSEAALPQRLPVAKASADLSARITAPSSARMRAVQFLVLKTVSAALSVAATEQ